MTLPKDIFSILLCVFVTYATGTNATTILGMDIDKVANDAELIFEGEVILHETRQNSNTGIIHTYVTFTVHDVVKGDFSADTIELKFAGGTFMGQIVEVRGLKIPKEGENGIYFVESTSRDLLNPLIGWSQGHFIIEQELGERRVRTIDRQTVTDIQSVSSIPSVIKKPQAIIEGDGDVAAGVLVDSSSLSIERALTVEEFKNRILDLLEN
ncbi:MAG: hypothetical protein VX206_09240 [Pseudomonadota bacterium]|jgi:hypothetical protein|nr:hypothetical protein [Pseudomonadales bacterium]MEE3290906.1 hypothetical protein [Pseudomonadota bacterium]|tara:strand:- start:401 stop:1033 length:633 start_codon:yes stop_codon:yes gene_type:complete